VQKDMSGALKAFR